jgi:hypothetical protein
MCSSLAQQVLMPATLRPSVRCFGFKEIRYIYIYERLDLYLRFLRKILPNCKFIFNVRNLDDVLSSAWWVGKDPVAAREQLQKTENAFNQWLSNFPDDSFLIRYEDIISKSGRLKEMFDFIGERYVEGEVDKVLTVTHSTRKSDDDN